MPAKSLARRVAAKSRRRPKIKLPAPRRGRRLPPGMVRLDYPKVRGYLVRIGYLRTKSGWVPKFKAYFSDTRCGGKAKARAAADAWLAGLVKTGRPPKVIARTEPARARRPRLARAR
jgi:hypothetical protein